MYKVSGKVLVKETGVGISYLQVILYDIDNRKQFLTQATPLDSELPIAASFFCKPFRAIALAQS